MKKDEIDVPVKTKETLNTELRYQQMLRDKVEEIRRICVQEQIPCFMAFGLRYADQELEQYSMKTFVENQDVNSDFLKTTAIIPEVLPMNFTDRRFSDFINVLNDFHTVPPSEYAKTTPEDIEIYGLPDTARQRSMNNIADKLLHDEENTNSKK